MAMMEVMRELEALFLWGGLATAVLTVVLSGSQGLGLTRLSLPFLVGTFFTGDRFRASVLGAAVYFLGGWLFAFLYFAVFARLGYAGLVPGLALGTMHGLFLLVFVLPLLPYVHPRMATEYDGPAGHARLEPPGFMGLHYGHRTPLTTVIGHALYGGVLGTFYGT
ncbi:MAG: hypothetical protein AB7U81_14560 [Thiohalomonadaceae bacterium]